MSKVHFAAWEALRDRLKAAIPGESYDSWFRDLAVVSWSGGCLQLSVPSRYAKHWIETHYQRELTACARAVDTETQAIQLEVVHAEAAADEAHASATAAGTPETAVRTGAPCSTARSAPAQATATAFAVGPAFAMESFVVGRCNRVAHCACRAILEGSGPAYNPLVLSGGHGLGKTHLLQALVRGLQARHPERLIRALTAEEFANAYLSALRDRKLDGFRHAYRQSHVLLVDDLQFLAGKLKTQDEFLHTFETLYQLGRQIVVACHLPPREIPGLDPRLAERFQSGLLAKLSPPDAETRTALVLAKARARGLALDPEAVETLTWRLEKSVRELEGAVNKLAALSAAEGRPADKDMALLALRELGYLRDGPLMLEEILAVVSAHLRHPADEIRSGKRHASLVRARHVAMFLAKQLTTHSLSEVGQFFGNRDHSTVLHAVRKVEAGLEHDTALRAEVQSLRRALGR